MGKRTLFIGDVHGCYEELIALCEKIGLKDEDHLYFVGDLINKGPKSLEVVEFVRNRPNTWSVIGNHEFFSFPNLEMSEDIESGRLILSEGAKKWARAQGEKGKSLEVILRKDGNVEWLQSLPRHIETDGFILIHGGIHPDFGLDTPIEVATLLRQHEGRPWYEYYTGEKLVIYGHWAADGLRIRENTIGLDTGCCFGGALTAYCLETKEFWQVRANDVYTVPVNWRGNNSE